jgi:hypothetical protein
MAVKTRTAVAISKNSTINVDVKDWMGNDLVPLVVKNFIPLSYYFLANYGRDC